LTEACSKIDPYFAAQLIDLDPARPQGVDHLQDGREEFGSYYDGLFVDVRSPIGRRRRAEGLIYWRGIDRIRGGRWRGREIVGICVVVAV
jgi:hypothetical protein